MLNDSLYDMIFKRKSTDSEFLSCLPKKGTKEGHEGLRPCDPNAASGWPAAKVGGALVTDQRTSL